MTITVIYLLAAIAVLLLAILVKLCVVDKNLVKLLKSLAESRADQPKTGDEQVLLQTGGEQTPKEDDEKPK